MRKPKIRFVKNLRLAAYAICLYWIHKIHIDEKFKNHPAKDDLIEHEMAHYRLINRMIETNSNFKRGLLELYNNLWDFFDVTRISLKYSRSRSFILSAIWHLFVLISVGYVVYIFIITII